ncbi:MAG TPA: hydroxymethylbilane synthase [Solirubrobacteraceae bacterium]|nr:hydroxymethylbilane synthase [Solirubrobacteraceae bacterium]
MRLATRASPLALAQARQVAEALGGAELVPLTTAGDRDRTAPDKRRWVSELERALLEDEADVAVHSAKDVPSQLADGLVLAGSPARADPRDALCGAGALDELPAGARVGTSSLRRTAQLHAVREDIEVVELHGNVDTRLRKLAEGDCLAIVVALAGLQRLGRAGQAGALLDPDRFVPAPGQGTLALETRTGDNPMIARVRAISDPGSEACLAAERASVRVLEADCHTPVGAYATRRRDGRLRLTVFVGREDGSAWVRDRLEGDDPEALGEAVAQRVLLAGAAELLGR